jgi:hypothetical protein
MRPRVRSEYPNRGQRSVSRFRLDLLPIETFHPIRWRNFGHGGFIGIGIDFIFPDPD